MPQCSLVVRRSLKSAPLPQWIATFFDFDPTVSTSRERALPEGEDLPPPRRRHTKLCAKGYSHRFQIQNFT